MIDMRRVAMLVAFLAACQSEPAPEAPAVVAPAVPAQGQATGVLTAEGWQGMIIGMSRDEVVAAMGEDANPEAVNGADPAQCEQFRPANAPEGMLAMLERGRLSRISLSNPAQVETEGGLSVGDSAASVKSHFGSRVSARPHKYVSAPAEYLTVWFGESTGVNARGIVYEIGEDGRVVHVHAGGPSITYVEGCL